MEKKINIKFDFCDVNFHYAKSENITEREIHDYNELLFYIDGEATFRTEGYTKELRPNTLIFIPKGKYHLFSPKAPERFTRLKISFDSPAIAKNLPANFFAEIKIAENIEDASVSLIKEAANRLKSEKYDALYLYGIFLTVIAAFSEMNMAAPETKLSAIISEALEFIESNLSAELSLKVISKSVGVSPSLLSHAFKREMGITPHSYISQKRLIYAKTLLNSGKKPCDIFSICGYRDYSSFYKAYVKAFKKSPKN